MRAAVLGAGVAGLSAALALRRRDVDVEVFEARPQAGGLVRSVDVAGLPFDLAGAHYVPLGDPLMVAELDRLAPRLDWDRHLVEVEFLAGGRVWRRLPVPALASGLRAGCRRGARLDAPLDVQLRHAYGSWLADRWLGPWAERLWGEPVHALQVDDDGPLLPGVPTVGPVSPRWLWLNRHVVSRARSTQPMGYPQGGMPAFVDALADGLTVHTRHEVASLQRRPEGWRVDDAGVFDVVVSTLPARAMLAALGESAGQVPLEATRLTVGCFDAPDVEQERHTIRFVIDDVGLAGCHRLVERRQSGRLRTHVDVTGVASEAGLITLGDRLGLGELVGHETTEDAFPIPRAGTGAAAEQLRRRCLQQGIVWTGRWALGPSSIESALLDGPRVAKAALERHREFSR